MISEEQAEIARTFAGSKASAWLMNDEVNRLPGDVKESTCFDIDSVAKSGPKAIKKVLKKASRKLKADPASLYCMYMDWKSNR